ncbi:murein transglycosylase A [Nisaea acidiphila]|uniref:peptidoglycan lytic exotransglycosylase n=1 Tax=Nisaea acidiphila TaxID=1862145 RepID=A0A9J7AXQ3_9PROT|nr:murein transglycosylase A [Nisaea acidiphila]UUX52183.1 murein transglycosylase A [Nisaea acidiphila]
MSARTLWLLIFFVLAGCTPEQPPEPAAPEQVSYEKVALSSLPGWSEDRLQEALPALKRSCGKMRRQSDSSTVAPAEIGGTVADWRGACDALSRLSDSSGDTAVRAFLGDWFDAYAVKPGPGLFTGYYEPELNGALQPRQGFETPLLARPDDLVLVNLGDWRSGLRGERIAGRLRSGRLVPYESRAEIESGALGQAAQPLVWLDDPIDAFFLHIQGSGRIRLEDGRILRVGYDGHNGHIYYPIGRYLVESGEIDKDAISLQTIRAWLKANPAQMHGVMNRNPSYIFFRAIDGEGPIGAQGVALTAGRSLAVDRRYIPLGAPVWLDIDYPDESGKPLKRLVVAQDTGGAIKGAVRGDVFWGHGASAAEKAGPMAAEGRYFVLLPKNLDIALRQ